MKPYILLTPSRNEEAFIDKTIRSVISQTVPPKKWLIISDGSTDGTDAIVESYAKNYDFLELVRVTGRRQRDFGSKVDAFTFGYEKIRDEEYDFLGILDADVSFEPFYYEHMLKKLLKDDRLGIVGGQKYEMVNGRLEHLRCSSDSVPGPFQLFRRACFEETGGFTPIPEGGEDAIIETRARLHGWKVRSFPEYRVYHYRPTGTASFGILSARFVEGIQEYIIGYHPLFELLKCFSRIFQKPFLVSSLARFTGYVWAALKRRQRPVPDDFVRYLRSEQLGRIKSVISGRGDQDNPSTNRGKDARS